MIGLQIAKKVQASCPRVSLRSLVRGIWDSIQKPLFTHRVPLITQERFLHSFLRDLPFRKDTNMMLLWTGFEQWLLIDIQRQKESRHRELTLWERGRG
jgi:hypothetical protein